EGAAGSEERQRRKLAGIERPHDAVARQHEARLRHVEAAVALEAPGVEADGDVVGEEVGAGEVEVDDPGEGLAAEEDVVGEEIGMDDAVRQRGRPRRLELAQLLAELFGEARPYLVGARAAALEEEAPAGDREVVRPAHREGAAGAMELGEGPADAGAVERLDAPRPHAVEEADDGGVTAAEMAE